MDLVKQDIEFIREVRRLCIRHDFDRATEVAKLVDDPNTRKTLLFICKSFKTAQINVQAA